MNMNAVVTGSTKGIGRAIVFALLKEGWNVAISSRTQQDLDSMRQEIKSSYPGRECLFHKVDFSNKEETIGYGQRITQQWSQIDLLINNVGAFVPGAVHTEGDGVIENMIHTNLYSAYHLTRTILQVITKNGKGLIINMCSIASFMSYPNGGAYTISKFALLGFSKALREELKPQGIKVTSLMPGATWSDSWKNADFPTERLMPPEDIAEIVLTLTRLSPASVVEEIVVRPLLGDLN